MIKFIFITSLLIISNFVLSEQLSLSKVRTLYNLASHSESDCKKLLEYVNNTENPVISGYKACSMMILAKFINNPLGKLSSFNNGKKLLEKCVNSNLLSLELRFLRFSVQSESPAFLGYKGMLKDDLKFIISNFITCEDISLKNLIKSFMLKTNNLTKSEKLFFQNTN